MAVPRNRVRKGLQIRKRVIARDDSYIKVPEGPGAMSCYRDNEARHDDHADTAQQRDNCNGRFHGVSGER